MKKQTLASRVLAFLKGGDEAKLSRFESKLDKYFTKQIAMRKDKIETLEEKVVDATEELNETVVNIDVDRINSTEGAESYVVTYVQRVQEKQEVVDDLKAQIEDLKAEIAKFESLHDTVYSVNE